MLTASQCVAFAVALAEQMGEDSISMLVLTEFGQTRIGHARVEPSEAQDWEPLMYDACGGGPLEDYLNEFYRNRVESCGVRDGCDDFGLCVDSTDGEAGTDVIYLTLENARAVNSPPLGSGLPDQEWDLATFVAPMLAELG